MVTLESLASLITRDGSQLLATIRDANPTPATAIAIGARLRRSWSSPLVAAALEQHELRERAAAKFPDSHRLWFTREGLEQATSGVIATHRAERFAGVPAIADLCCGIGGDLIALATQHPGMPLAAVDRDPLHLAIAQLNLAATGAVGPVSFIEGDVREVQLPPETAVFIDPARRSERGRLTSGESEPPLAWCLALAASGRAVGIKFAPGIEHGRVPAGWELELIALGPELKEAVLWSPGLARTDRIATVIFDGQPQQLVAVPGDPVPVHTPEPGEHLIDPNPAVTRAGLVADFARSIGGAMIDDRIAFLVTGGPVQSPFGRSLEVLASLPWNERHLKRALSDLGAGPVDIRRRGLPGDVDAITRRLRGKGSLPVTVAMTRVADQPWAIVCRSQ